MALISSATFNGMPLSTYGMVGEQPFFDFFSPIALVSHGFLFNVRDQWFKVDPWIIQNVTWTIVSNL